MPAAAAGSSLRSAQSAALLRMLDLHRDAGERQQWHDPWKVLVYDAYCRDIISPLLKVGDLRKQGITLHLLLDVEREAITDVPAIYFVQPTAANIKRLCADCAKALYEAYHINFTPAVPRPLLEELAASTLESGSVSQVSRVVDQYLNFASVEEDFFALLLPQSYQRLHDPSTPDHAVESTIDQIVNGLFSVVVTLGAVPVLRYAPTGGPAQMVAEQLGRRLHDAPRTPAALLRGCLLWIPAAAARAVRAVPSTCRRWCSTRGATARCATISSTSSSIGSPFCRSPPPRRAAEEAEAPSGQSRTTWTRRMRSGRSTWGLPSRRWRATWTPS